MMHAFDSRPVAANLENPLYYLENMETIVAWVANHHADLLLAHERDRLHDFFELPRPARALLTRMVMRSGNLFRADKLRYPELGSSEADALALLIGSGWLAASPPLTLDELFRLFTLAELRPAFVPILMQAGLAKSLPKAQMREALQGIFADARILTDWLSDLNAMHVADAPGVQVVRDHLSSQEAPVHLLGARHTEVGASSRKGYSNAGGQGCYLAD